MPTPTYTPLANITLGSSAASVTFSSISQSYKDLVLVTNTVSSTSATCYYRFNGDTGANYNWVYMRGTGSAAQSSSGSSDTSMWQAALNTNDGMIVSNIMDYSATDKHKTALTRFDISATLTAAFAQRWASTSAITSLTISMASGTFNSGSTFALYGVAA